MAGDKPGFSDLTQTTSSGTEGSTASNASITIMDYEFCSSHGRELCDDCGINAVEDNDFVSGIDHVEGRAPLEVAWTVSKNGEYLCKKHGSAKDGCFQFKKQILANSKLAAKNQKKNSKNKNVSNLIA